MLTLYPPIKPYARHTLPVSGGHKLYIDESGNPSGIPVIFLHAGPGNGCDKHSRRFFDPNLYRIILLDQRGCGRSTPHGSLENNTTEDLLEDLEAVRRELKIERWMLFGGAWGAALSLLYASRHPGRVLAMVLRGLCLYRQQDIDWLFNRDGVARIFPDYWEVFANTFPEKDQSNLLQACYSRLTGEDELARMAIAKAFCSWQAHCATLRPSQEVLDSFAEPHRALALARLSSHYLLNKAFLMESILSHSEQWKDIPGIIVHGRYDLLSPLENSTALQELWPDAELHVVRDAGHSAAEASMRDALVRATDSLGQRFRKEFGLDRSS